MQDEEEVQNENEKSKRAERFKLPPIFQAAARHKNRPVDESEGLLRGQKARTFEQEKPPRNVVGREQKSPARMVKHEAISPRKDAVFHGFGTNEGKIQLEPLDRSRRKSERTGKSLEGLDKSLELDKQLYVVDTTKQDARNPKSEKTKRRRRTKTESPQRNLPLRESSRSNGNVAVAYNEEKAENVKENKTLQSQETAPFVNVEENSLSGKKHQKPQHSEVKNKSSGVLSLTEGDMVAVKVPEKLYIKGQPCLGKITALADHQGLLTVHYYTGSYQGRWRPMMSRTSPYLRKVAADDVLCKFKLSSDGRMSPVTQRKLKTVVDDERKEEGNT